MKSNILTTARLSNLDKNISYKALHLQKYRELYAKLKT